MVEQNLSDLYPVGSKKWLEVKQAEIYQWNFNIVKSIGNTAPLNMKLDYALGLLEVIEE